MTMRVSHFPGKPLSTLPLKGIDNRLMKGFFVPKLAKMNDICILNL